MMTENKDVCILIIINSASWWCDWWDGSNGVIGCDGVIGYDGFNR